MDRRPRRGARHPAAVAPDAARPRRAVGARAGHAGAHLLQGRVGLARGIAQDEHVGAAGVLQRGGGHEAPGHRDRRRAMGERAGVRVLAVRPRVQGLHGAGVVRAEAVSPRAHGDVGCVGRAVTGRRRRQPRFARPRDQRRGRRRRVARRHALLARFRAQPRAAPPDRHRARGEGAAPARGGGAPRCRDRQLRRRFEPRWHRAAVRARRRRAPRRGGAVVVPDAHRGLVRLRLRRHRGHDAAAPDVHPRARVRAAVDPRRRAALPRRLADHLQPGEGRPHGGRRLPAGEDVRGRGAVRHAPRARCPHPRPGTRSAP